MPGNTLRFASAPLEDGKLLFARFGGFGVLGAELPTTGEQGPSFLLDDLDGGDESTEVRPRITAVPSAGTFTADEFGAFALVGAPAGTYTFKYRPIVGVTELGEATETIVIGGATTAAFDAVLPGLDWSGAAQLSASSVAFDATLPALAWAGVVQLQSVTPVAFAAALPALVWAGAVSLDGTVAAPQREVWRGASRITTQWRGTSAIDLEGIA